MCIAIFGGGEGVACGLPSETRVMSNEMHLTSNEMHLTSNEMHLAWDTLSLIVNAATGQWDVPIELVP